MTPTDVFGIFFEEDSLWVWYDAKQQPKHNLAERNQEVRNFGTMEVARGYGIDMTLTTSTTRHSMISPLPISEA